MNSSDGADWECEGVSGGMDMKGYWFAPLANWYWAEKSMVAIDGW